MSDGMNKVILVGNLGADPELRVTPGGQAILKLRVATTESYLDKNNTRAERTEWHSVTVWGKRAEGLAKVLAKGDRICVEGGLRTSSYEKDGEKRYRTEVSASNVVLCGGRRQGAAEDDREKTPSRYGKTGYGANAKHTSRDDVPDPDPHNGAGYDDAMNEIPF